MTARATWEEVWLNIAWAMARRSRCVRTQVGAVIVNEQQRVVATGYNGPPADYRSYNFDSSCAAMTTKGVFCPRASDERHIDYDNCVAIHAEANALLFCDRRDRERGTIYVTSVPCFACAKLIANSGLHHVVIAVVGSDDAHRDPDRTIKFLLESRLTVQVVDDRR